MRCKVCGAYNEDYLEFCENCAAPLEPEAATNGPTGFSSAGGSDQGEQSAWGFVRSPNWPKPDFDANTVSEQDIPKAYLNRFEPRQAGAVQEGVEPTEDKPVSRVQNEPLEETPVPRFNAADPSPIRRNVPVCGPVAESEPEDEPALPAVRKELKKPQRAESFSDYGYAGKRKSRKFRGSKNPVVFYAAAGVLVLLIVVFAIALLTKGSGPIFGGLFSKSNITKQATITPDTSDPANKRYLITVYAKTGSHLRFTAGSLVKDGDDLIVTDGKKSMIVDAEIFMPTEPVDSASLNIYPDIVVIGKDGTEEKVEFVEPIVIEVPSIGLTLTAPVSPFETATSDITISGTVDDTTASVFVGDNQFTVDETGGFSGTYSLSAEGPSTITVEARKNGYQIARQTITVNYTASTTTGSNGNDGTTQPVSAVTGTPSFDFADDQSRRTTEATITVKGTAQSGAALSVTGVELSNPVTVNSDGTFSFTVKLDEVGLYTAAVSSNLNGTVGTRTIYLERNHADKDAYIEGAHMLDYQYLIDAPNHEQAYELVGKVAEVIQTSPFVIAKVTTQDGDVLFYYYSGIASVEANDGKTYEIYGDPNGKDANGTPILYAWYIYKR
jgi:hypothetical protein